MRLSKLVGRCPVSHSYHSLVLRIYNESLNKAFLPMPSNPRSKLEGKKKGKKKSMMAEEGKEAQIYGDILESILCYVPLIDLAPASLVSHTWKRAVHSSLECFNQLKPWLIVHTQETRQPYATTAHAYDPRSQAWVEIEQPSIKYVSALRSSHSTLLYMLSPFRFAFSGDPLHLTWHQAQAPLVWRSDPIVALVGHRVVVGAGMCDFTDDPSPIETYDLRTGKWDTCKSMPAVLQDTPASTSLSVAVDEHKMYVMEKSTGVTYSFDPSSKTWRGPFDLRPGQNVFSSVIAFVNDGMVVVGLLGEEENVKGVKMWEVEDESWELREMGEMPSVLEGKLKGGSPRVASIAITSMGDFAYLHNPSDPAVLITCQVSEGVCKWGTVKNVGGQNSVFTCSNVGLAELLRALGSGTRRFAIKNEAKFGRESPAEIREGIRGS